MTPGCFGCHRSAAIGLDATEVERQLAAYLAARPGEAIVDEASYRERLAVCTICADLRYAATTCRHSGCLVAVRAKLADKRCPATPPRW